MTPNFGRNKIIPVLLFVPVLAFFMVIFTAQKTDPDLQITSATAEPTPSPTPTVINVDQQPIRVGVAATESTRRQGLSGRQPLDNDEGLLFVFPQDSRPQFWMKDMLFDIDIIWINDGVINKIDANVPAPENPGDELPYYLPTNGPVDYVLEMNAGSAQSFGFEVGDSVDLSNIIKI